jgi:iron complex outermembrane receptor protein
MRTVFRLRLLTATSILAMTASGAALAQGAEPGELEQIVVTGSRLSTGFTAPTPVSVLSSEQLETRAVTMVGEALQEIPSFRPNGPTQGPSGTFSPGQSLLDLRGLGTTRTLVLVDGRRQVPNNNNGTFDTNMIPTSLVERTEVVTGGASAAYGSDAVAGVVNFVLRDRLQGVRGNIQYGIAEHGGDSIERGGSLAFGTSFAGGRGHIVLGGDASNNDPSGTMYSREWGAREPGIVGLTAARPAGVPANLVTERTQYALAPGSRITSCVRGTTVLAGAACPFFDTTFDMNGQPVRFQRGPLVGSTLMVGPEPGGPGTGNYGYSAISSYRLKTGGDRQAFLGRVTFDATPDVTLFGQFAYGRYQVTSYGNFRVRNDNQIFIARANPFIPASLAAQMDAQGITQLRMNRMVQDFGSINPNNENAYKQFTVGARGTFGGGWRWDATYVNGKADFTYSVDGNLQLPSFYAALHAVRGPDGQPTCGTLATNPNLGMLTAAQQAQIRTGCVPFNPFGPFSMSQATYDYMAPFPMQQFTDYDRQSAAVNVSGEPFSTWAGPVALAVGAEWWQDNVVTTVDPLTEQLSIANAWFAVNPRSGAGKISAKEGYAEIGVPLARDAGLARALDLNAAVRHTDYSTSGGVTTWKIGGTWDPAEFLRLRVTRSRDIRAPNVPELFIKGNDSFGTRTNPRTGVSAQLSGASVPNLNLDPEKADTWTAGVILQPVGGMLSGFRASVDYYDIDIKGVIGSLSFVEVLERYYIRGDQSVAPFITFDNSAIGFSRVDSPLFNLSRQKVNGVDFELQYRAPEDAMGVPGRFSLSALGSYLHQHETFDAAGVSLNDIAGAIPKWRWTINLSYDVGRLSTNLQARTSSGIRYRLDLVGPEDPGYNPAATNSINKNSFPSAATFSLAARYTLIQRDARRVEVYGIIDNLLDKAPPYGSWGALSTQGQGGSGGYNPYDAIGRYFKMGVRFQY